MIRLANKTQVRAALRQLIRDAKKAEADILNRTARNTAIYAAKATPVTTKGRIRADLAKDDLLAKLASEWLAKKQGKFTREEHRQAMERIAKARILHRGAVRVGWYPAISDLGGRPPITKSAVLSAIGSASKGYGKKATPRKLEASFHSAVFTRSHTNTGKKSHWHEIPVAVRALRKAQAQANREGRQAERRLAQKLRKYA